MRLYRIVTDGKYYKIQERKKRLFFRSYLWCDVKFYGIGHGNVNATCLESAKREIAKLYDWEKRKKRRFHPLTEEEKSEQS